jgi:prepilin-type N-terminal cleavage/methylation domain-containing protein
MRRAFTLVEVVLALVIAGLLALAARAVLVAGIDTQERLQRHAAVTEGDARFRALVVQALRHMTDAPTVGVSPFVLRDTTLANAAPSQAVEFYSRGLSQPAGTGTVMHIRLVPSERGLTIRAVDANGFTSSEGVAPGIGAMHVRVQTRTGEWVATWPRTLQTPAAVALELVPFGTPRGALAPIIVNTRLAGGP